MMFGRSTGAHYQLLQQTAKNSPSVDARWNVMEIVNVIGLVSPVQHYAVAHAWTDGNN